MSLSHFNKGTCYWHCLPSYANANFDQSIYTFHLIRLVQFSFFAKPISYLSSCKLIIVAICCIYLGQNIRKLVKDGLIIRKPVAVHSRARVRQNAIARRKGRHTGTGKRKGTANARMPEKVDKYSEARLIQPQNTWKN